MSDHIFARESRSCNCAVVPHPSTQSCASKDDFTALRIDDLGAGDPKERHGASQCAKCDEGCWRFLGHLLGVEPLFIAPRKERWWIGRSAIVHMTSNACSAGDKNARESKYMPRMPYFGGWHKVGRSKEPPAEIQI